MANTSPHYNSEQIGEQCAWEERNHKPGEAARELFYALNHQDHPEFKNVYNSANAFINQYNEHGHTNLPNMLLVDSSGGVLSADDSKAATGVRIGDTTYDARGQMVKQDLDYPAQDATVRAGHSDPPADTDHLSPGGKIAAEWGDIAFAPIAAAEGAIKQGIKPAEWAGKALSDGVKTGNALEFAAGVGETAVLPLTTAAMTVYGAAEGLAVSGYNAIKDAGGAIGRMWNEL